MLEWEAFYTGTFGLAYTFFILDNKIVNGHPSAEEWMEAVFFLPELSGRVWRVLQRIDFFFSKLHRE